ncbi:uncharacterized protein LOC141528080 isoform X2 [Cotesia typhae]|uniref:uncharacterized protein LOC141528080 isoform X2 n=1 Tax=Cotesia typhae TaxID=2053667 RepID=UPI003D688AD5
MEYYSSLSVDELSSKLLSVVDDPEIIKIFKDEDIDDAAFLQLTNEDLSQLKIKIGPKKKLLALIDSLNQEKITGSYIIDSSGVLEKQTQNETVCSSPLINLPSNRSKNHFGQSNH